ncbi:unnamed protein product [Lactuca virosa]|uniref:Uncharacterized protein n=1 Tax=Lactuca virosa TaxID=75947 RepID=A0AAU9LIK7_9ASTR|nr:unnamed protein product [Lactuca virosa]
MFEKWDARVEATAGADDCPLAHRWGCGVTGNSPTTGGSWQLSTQGMEVRIHSVVNLMFDRKRNKEEQRGFDF